jgi:hypothetical protein
MAVIWGIPYLLIKIAVGEVTPASLVLLRTAFGAALLLPIAATRGWLTPLLPYWRWVIAYTVVEVSLPWFLLSDAERRLSSSLTGLLIAAVPLIGAVLQRLTRGDERMDPGRLAGLMVGLAGVAVLVGLNVSFKDLGAVVEVGLVAIGYASGPLVIATTDVAVRTRPAGRSNPRGRLHGARLPTLFRPHRRGRPGEGDRDHVFQSGGRAATGRHPAHRATDRRSRRPLRPDSRRIGAGDAAV